MSFEWRGHNPRSVRGHRSALTGTEWPRTAAAQGFLSSFLGGRNLPREAGAGSALPPSSVQGVLVQRRSCRLRPGNGTHRNAALTALPSLGRDEERTRSRARCPLGAGAWGQSRGLDGPAVGVRLEEAWFREVGRGHAPVRLAG